MSRTILRFAGVTVAVATLAAARIPAHHTPRSLPQSESYALHGRSIGIWNLAGRVSVEPAGSGDAVTVRVVRQGADAARLSVAQGTIGEMETLRIVYPGDRVTFRPPWNRSGDWSTDLRVRDDGTFGGTRDDDDGRRVRISSSDGGLAASADLTVSVPKGQRIRITLAVGDIVAQNVDGTISLDTYDGDISVTKVTGDLDLDTGSGSVKADGVDGDLSIDTGSGDVTAGHLSGHDISIDTGSGNVTVRGAAADALSVDTGSGDVSASGLTARRVKIDTGSGDVDLDYASAPTDVDIDTGSGGVRIAAPEGWNARVDLETSGGEIRTDFPIRITSREQDELHGVIGDGTGRLRVETGSGDIVLRKK